ncbi:MAG: hypothetical protein F6K40_34885 [Okeania sp. SIO3I5]|uniref:hypothetical protein n=1 Tax=Okeania sp. SIO3I5 TaxID=2607805 RepID=UPI0013BE554D|nr:hypothetical protein [Okeania sp. SIO3I5]NEQ41118.1 hypothetical protein [Okeania sp. SIO3I5]
MKNKKDLVRIQIPKERLKYPADYVRNKLLSDPVSFELIDISAPSVTPSVIWKRALLLQTVIDNIITEYFICNYKNGQIDMTDFPLGIDVLETDILWVNNVLNDNPLFPLEFNIFQQTHTKDLRYESNYLEIKESLLVKDIKELEKQTFFLICLD